MDKWFQELIKSVAELDESFELRPEHNLREDLDIDSLKMIDVVLGVEEEVGSELPEEALAKLTTVGELYDETQKALAG